jgi:hypothetical protein
LHALITHPAVQAVLAPFLLALLTAELLQRLRLSGLAIIAGFAITVYLISGFGYAPLTGTRKIIWLGLASGLLGILLTLISGSLWRPILAILSAAATVWVVFSTLSQYNTAHALQWGLGIALYVAWIVFWMDDLQDAPTRAASAGLALGLGSGATLLIASVTLLGKFDLAIGSAAFAYLLIMLISNSHLPCGRTFTLPVALITALTGAVALLTTKLPWTIFVIFAAIPLVAKLPVSDKSPVWIQATLLTSATLLCAIGAAYLSWRMYN